MQVENSNFLINESLKLILVSHKNELNQFEIKKVIQSVKDNPYLEYDYSVIVDIRNAHINMTEDDIDEASIFIFENLQQSGIKKFAIIVLKEEQRSKSVEFVNHYEQSSFFYFPEFFFKLNNPQHPKW
jgi:hypothetical protein